MAQNTSSAVMQQRTEAHDSLDDFPTPPWATRAVCEKLMAHGYDFSDQTVWEPCCNRGHMAKPLGEYFRHVIATDILDYGWEGQTSVSDFLIDWAQDRQDVDWVIANPPFRLALEFIKQGLKVSRKGVAVFVRTSFVEGVGRYQNLFRDTPEALFLPFVERVVLWKGVLLDPDVCIQTWSEKQQEFVTKKPSTATSYCWLMFRHGQNGPGTMDRIAPCRRRLTRPGDYPALPEHMVPREGRTA